MVLPTSTDLDKCLRHSTRFDWIPEGTQHDSTLHALLANQQAFQQRAKCEPRVRHLGRPRDLEEVLHLPEPEAYSPPPPVTAPIPAPEVPPPMTEPLTTIPGYHTDLIETPSGWKPRAGGFHRAAAHWAPYRDQIRPRTFAILQTGVRLHWNGTPPLPLWLHNPPMDELEHQFVEQEIQTLLATEAIREYSIDYQGVPICICPLKVVTDSSGKSRLCWDGRYPNGFLRHLPCRFETLDQLRMLIMAAKQCGDLWPLLLKVDLRAGYHHLLMHPETAAYLCFMFNNRIYYWRALPFGLSQAPPVFEGVMMGLKAVQRGPLRTPHMGYLDDLHHVISQCQKMPIATLLQMVFDTITTEWPVQVRPGRDPVSVLVNLWFFGCSLNVPKIVYDTMVEVLGILFDTVRQETSVPTRRRDTLLPLLHDIAASSPAARVPAKTLAAVAGQLVSMYEGLRHARTLLWAVYYTLYPVSLFELWRSKILLPETVRQTCHWWEQHFDEYNSRPFVQAPHFAFEWDAAEQGAGGILYGQGQLHLLHADRPAAERHLHNNVWELYAGPELIIPCLPIIAGSRLSMAGDNTFAVSYLKRGGGANPFATAMIQTLFRLFIAHAIELMVVSHLPGWLNVYPDAISRIVDFRSDWALKPEVLKQVYAWMATEALPLPTAEAFATALNHHLPRWCSRWMEPGGSWVNFFNHAWQGEVLWCNPPFCLLMRTLIHLVLHHISAYLVVPHWGPEQAWWDPVWSMAVQQYELPPDAFTSVATGHKEGFHAPDYRISVLALML